MNSNTKRKIKRTLAVALALTMFWNNIPETLLTVKADGTDISVGADFTITLEGGTTGEDDIKQYTLQEGKAEPAVVVTKVADSSTLQENTDYTVVYTNSTAVGEATVTVTGAGSYSGSKEITYKIVEETTTDTPKELTSDNLTIEFEESNTGIENVFAYTGEVLTPDVTITYSEGELNPGRDYELSYSTNSKEATYVGGASVKVKGIGNYTGEVTEEFYIKYDLSEATVESTTIGYNDGKPAIPELQVVIKGANLSQYDENTSGGNYKIVAGSNVTNAGDASITLEAADDTMGSCDFKYTILPKELDAEQIAVDAVTYTGAGIELGNLVIRDTTIQENDNYKTISGKNYTINCDSVPQNAGEYTLEIRATEGSNYKFVTGENNKDYAEIEFTVAQLNLKDIEGLKLEYQNGIQNIYWTDEQVDIANYVTVKYMENTLDKADYEISSSPSPIQAAGTYQIQISAGTSGNLVETYTFTEENNFSVDYDTSITTDNLNIAGVVETAEESTYYYNDAEQVIISPQENYSIKENVTGGSLKDDGTVILNENATELKISVMKMEDDTVQSGNEFILKFIQDTEAPNVIPDITYTNPYPQNADEPLWAKEVSSLELTCTDERSGVKEIRYYYKDEKGECSETEVISLTEEDNNIVTIEESKLAKNVTYYFWAVDNLGNETAEEKYIEVKIPQIDTTSPTITIKDGENLIYSDNEESGETSVHINDSSKTYTVTFEDNESGYDESQYTPEATFTAEDELKTECKPIENTVTDNVGNESSHTLCIYYDPLPPEIADFTLNGIEQSSILTNQDVIIEGTVAEQFINDEYQLEGIKLYTVSIDESGEEQLSEFHEDKYAQEVGAPNVVDGKVEFKITIKIKESSSLNENFKIIASDKAGNRMSYDFSVEIDKVAPSITEIDLSETSTVKDDITWYKNDTTFTVSVNNNHPSSAKVSLFYCAREDGKTPDIPTVSSDDEGIWTKIEYTGNTDDIFYDAEEDVYTFTISEDDNQFSGIYYFWVQDSVGNAPENIEKISFNKDKIPANTIVNEDEDNALSDAAIYIEYVSDGELDNAKEELTEPDKYSFLNNVLNRLFAKEYINVRLYIYDNLSRVDKIVYECGDGKKEKYAEKNTSAKIGNQYYSYVELKLTKAEAECLKVNQITDCAGNVYEGSIETKEIPKGNTVLIIDNVTPKLTDNYDTADGEKDGKKFYKPSEEGEDFEVVKLTYKEAFFEKNVDDAGKIIYPSITIMKNNEVWMDETNSDYENYVKWGEYNNGADAKSITAQVILPYSEEGAEVEYRILSQYEDGSKNRMEGANLQHGSVTKENGYKSGIIVLDNKAPEFTAYSLTGESDRKYNTAEGEIPVYQHREGEDGDVTLSFKIEDAASYWKPENVSLKIYQTGRADAYIQICGDDSSIAWDDNGSVHTATYKLEACKNAPSCYYAEISYRDVAGNQQTAGVNVNSERLSGGTYTGEAFILDEETPEFNISYNTAYRLIKNEDTNAANDKSNAVPETGYTAYYNDTIQVTFTIDEAYVNEQTTEGNLSGLADFTLTNTIAGQPKLPEIEWSKEGGLYRGTLIITEEGSYSLKATYRDLAKNNMTAGKTVQGSESSEAVQDGVYRSIKLVLDKTEPTVSTWYSVEANGEVCEANLISDNRRQFFNQPVYLNIKIEDSNIRTDELKSVLRELQLSKSDAESAQENSAVACIWNEAEGELHNGAYILSIPLSTEENYTIPVAYEDLAGNSVSYSDNEVTVDTTLPTFTLEYNIVESEGILDNIINAINYKSIGYLFANGRLEIKATAEDATAGVHDILIQVKNRDGELVKESVKDIAADKWAEQQVHNIVIPLNEASDFQGSVDVIVTDWSANTSNTDRGYIVESKDMHERTSSAVINTLTSPSRIFEGEEYYNTDVKLEITLQDNYSGILDYRYVADKLSGSQSFAEEAGGTADDFTQEAVKELQRQVDLQNLVLTSNENGVRVWAQLTDNAGYTTSIERTYNIDKTKPIINVTYDLNSPANEVYYNAARTATVTIQERNFNPGDVQFIITNTEEAKPSISGWSTSGSGDNETHTCTVTFAEDGDYTFTVAFEDKAGNVADYSRVDTFTIDRTEPQYTVTYDNNESLNGQYYAAGRTATIDILEHNFDAALVNIEITASNGEGGVPSVSGWSRNGDHNVATVHFSGDADYTFDISGADMAANPMADYAGDAFVVDTTAPEIEIFDIENMSANNGVVMPGIRYSDINYDAESSVIDMVGYHNGKVDMDGDITRTGTGVEIKLHDFEHSQSMDDLYTMNATVYDLAGNSSEASVVFSVNRFGSVYTFDEATEELIGANGKYYTNEEQDIVITETNVDTLEFKEITCNLNGELMTLKEGENYTVSESGSDMSWKQYTYTLAKSNFVEEGTYLLTIYSEDRATNTSDNSSKGKKIEFVVDKTSPSVLISGIADNEQYRENSKEVTIDVQDNVRLSEVKVYLNNEQTVYSAAQLEESDGKITLTIGSANSWQTLRITAYDAAGNEMTSEELHFLITTNILIQFIMNRQLLFGFIAAVAVIGAGGFWFLGYKRRKKEEAE